MLLLEGLMIGIGIMSEDGQDVRYGLAKEYSGNKDSTLILGSVCRNITVQLCESERLQRYIRLP